MAAALCVVIVLTAAANSLLIALICTQPALRNTSNFFLVSLFTSDLMVGLVVMPPAMLNALYGRWVLARGLCLLWTAFDVMCCSASILNLCLISLDRYLLILSPLRYKLRMTAPRALALILGAWSLAALASFLPLLLGWHELGKARTSAPGQCRLLASLPYVLVASGVTFSCLRVPSASPTAGSCWLPASRRCKWPRSPRARLRLARPWKPCRYPGWVWETWLSGWGEINRPWETTG